MYLPRQPLSRQSPWLIAGILLALIIIVIAIYGYLKDGGRTVLKERTKKIVSCNNLDILGSQEVSLI